MNQFSYHRFLLQEEADDRVLRPSAPSFTSTSPFDSSLVLTVLVLLTVLFFMAFFSLYIRRFSNNNNNITNSDNSVQNSNSPPRFSKRGGLDISTVQSLPDVLYGAESSCIDSDMPTNIFSECPICLTEFEEREKVKVIPYCGHGFHPCALRRGFHRTARARCVDQLGCFGPWMRIEPVPDRYPKVTCRQICRETFLQWCTWESGTCDDMYKMYTM